MFGVKRLSQIYDGWYMGSGSWSLVGQLSLQRRSFCRKYATKAWKYERTWIGRGANSAEEKFIILNTVLLHVACSGFSCILLTGSSKETNTFFWQRNTIHERKYVFRKSVGHTMFSGELHLENLKDITTEHGSIYIAIFVMKPLQSKCGQNSACSEKTAKMTRYFYSSYKVLVLYKSMGLTYLSLDGDLWKLIKKPERYLLRVTTHLVEVHSKYCSNYYRRAQATWFWARM